MDWATTSITQSRNLAGIPVSPYPGLGSGLGTCQVNEQLRIAPCMNDYGRNKSRFLEKGAVTGVGGVDAQVVCRQAPKPPRFVQ